MKRYTVRILSVLLLLCMTVNLLPGVAFAAEAADEAPQKEYEKIEAHPNCCGAEPLKIYETPITEEPGEDAVLSGLALLTEAEAIETLRANLITRNTEIVIRYAKSSLSAYDLFYKAVDHTGVPTEGDYLYHNMRSVGISYSGNDTVVYTVRYYTTVEQEAQMDAAVANAMAQMDFAGKNEYEKIRTVYDYILDHVTYDHEHLDDPNYPLKQTAYAALVNGTSVCEGYAVLFYRLALEAGIDCRYISGSTPPGPHAWNIVKLGDVYYYADPTWDDTESRGYLYFLRSRKHFANHTPGSKYVTEAFLTKYPMADGSYGKCGDNTYYFLSNDDVLTISGEGDMNMNTTSGIWGTLSGKVHTAIISEGVTSIGTNAFIMNKYLTTVSLPNSLRKIGRGAFNACTLLTDVTIPSNVTEIGDSAFRQCTSLTEIVLPDTLTSIGEYAFVGCSGLTSIIVPDSVTKIGFNAFAGCSQITKIHIPSGLTEIDDAVFASCSSLTDVTLPEGLTTIDRSAFENCSSLESIVIPSTVTYIGLYAFGSCTSLSSVTFTGKAPHFRSTGTIFENVTATVYYPAGDKSWDEDVMKQHGGTLTWEAVEPKNGWVKEEGKWYYYENDVPATGWLKSGGYWYYLDAKGEMQTGWVGVGGKWYYMNQNGVMLTGWVKDGGKWYYMASGGAMQTGWVSVGGKWYYMDANGAMQTGLKQIGGKYYYFASGGAMQTGWQTVNGVRHLFDSKGAAVTGWYQENGKWYFLKNTGAMSAGWIQDGGYWYFMDPSTGIMQTGWVQDGGYWYYMNKSGVMQTGWVQDGSYWYYMNKSGVMQTGTQVINGKTYKFNSSGVWIG